MRTSRPVVQRVQELGEPNLPSKEPDPGEMLETANHLIRSSIQALMRMRGVDWETATRWIKAAAATVVNKQPSRAPE